MIVLLVRRYLRIWHVIRGDASIEADRTNERYEGEYVRVTVCMHVCMPIGT